MKKTSTQGRNSLFLTCLSMFLLILSAGSATAKTIHLPEESLNGALLAERSFSSDYVHIPDSVFKAKLLANEKINTNGNEEIEFEEAEAVLVLKVEPGGYYDPKIHDLTGLEAFVNVRTILFRGLQVDEIDLSALSDLRIVDFSYMPLNSVDFSHNQELVKITAIGADLKDLDVSNNPKLEYINVSGNHIQSLTLVSNSLTTLHINRNYFFVNPGSSYERNYLTSLDVSACPNLSVLSAANNRLSSLDLSSNAKLVEIDISGNPLTDLELPSDASLRELDVKHTNLTDLDVSSNDSLEILRAFSSQLTGLDLSNNPLLQELDLDYTPIEYLNLKNGGNHNMKEFSAHQTKLICVLVDDPEYFEQNFYSRKLEFSVNCEAEEELVYIPDPNFKAVLLDSYANTNGDDEIQVGEARNYRGKIWASNKDITDLTGFEAFTHVTVLHANNNPITKADFTNSSNLKALRLLNSELDSIDLTNCPQLYTLQISNANLKTIDLSNNTALRQLEIDHNQLSYLDLSNNPNLYYVWANNNELDSLIFGANSSLREIKASNNNLTSLDVSGTDARFLSANNNEIASFVPAPGIRELHIRNNELNSFDASEMQLLEKLVIFNNDLSVLDLSGNSNLEYVNVKNNDLTFLDVRNGNNNDISTFIAYNNELSCINVSDPDYAYDNWWDDVDEGVGFSTDCSDGVEEPAIVEIPDPIFKSALVGNTSINTNEDDEIQVSEAEAYTGNIVVNDLGISDLTGIEAFVNITTLNFRNNSVSEIDISTLTKLTYFYGGNNALTSLDPSNNPQLVNLFAYRNNLTSIDVTSNPNLEFIYLSDNQLSTLDVSNCTSLEGLEVQRNQLTDIQFPSHTIFEVWVEDNQLTSMNLDVHNLFCQNNQITSVDSATVRTIVDASGNSLTSIDFSGKPTKDILVRNNQLTEVILIRDEDGDIGRSFHSEGNPDLYCVEINDTAYAEANPYYTVDEWTSFSTDCSGEVEEPAIVEIPDPNFKALLVGNSAININEDEEIQVREAKAYTDKMLVPDLGISDITGIEAFVNITVLAVGRGNNINEIDISTLTKLTYLDVSGNNLTSLDISNNTELIDCHASGNNLTAIDFTSNPNLEFISLVDNQLSTLDLSSCTSLTGLWVQHNQLTDIQFPPTHVHEVWAEGNELTSLNLDVFVLNCQNNQITSLDGVTIGAALNATGNNLTSIDVSDQNVQFIEVGDNQLTDVILGKEHEILDSVEYFESQGNPNLFCVEVNDIAYAEANYIVDEWTSFSTDCSGGDARMAVASTATDALLSVSVYPNPSPDYVKVIGDELPDELHLFSIKGDKMNVRFENGEADIRHLKNGIYVLKAYKAGETSVIRIVKN